MSDGSDGRPRGARWVKVAFVLAGIATFGVGIRMDDIWIRWAGVGLVAVAWFLRFFVRD